MPDFTPQGLDPAHGHPVHVGHARHVEHAGLAGNASVVNLGSPGRLTTTYIGPTASPLLACFHQPDLQRRQACGIVLCQPAGREYVLLHRVFQRLALLLARAGFPVLRFDHFGCGDSAGDAADADLLRWQADIGVAIDALRLRMGVPKVALIGFRLGGSLAALAACGRHDINALALWDPVVEGAPYLQALRQAHAHWAQTQRLPPGPAPAGPAITEELLGFPLPAGLAHQIAALNLPAQIDPFTARRVLLLDSGSAEAGCDALARQLQALGLQPDRQSVHWPEFWGGDPLQDVLMPPARVLQALVSWAKEACP